MATSTDERAALLEEYVLIEAMESACQDILRFIQGWPNGPFPGTDVLEPEAISIGAAPNETTVGSLFGRLWPDDEDVESGEYYSAHARASRLESALFAALGGPFGQEWLIRQAIAASESAVRDELRAHERTESERGAP